VQQKYDVSGGRPGRQTDDERWRCLEDVAPDMLRETAGCP